MNAYAIFVSIPILALMLPPQIQASDLSGANLTITNSMAIGVVNINESGSANVTAVPGFRVLVTQESTEDTFTNTLHFPGYYTTEPVVNNEYGWVETGSYQAIYGWGVINSYWVADVWGDNSYTDENGNWVTDQVLVTPGYWQEEYGDVYLGEQWVSSGQEWQVISSNTTYEEVYHEARTETEEVVYQSFQRPKIKFAATRTDANWAWQVPTANDNQQVMRDIMVVFDGGLKIPSLLPEENMSLLADNLTYSRTIAGTNSNATQASQTKAEKVKLNSTQVFNDTSRMEDEATLKANKLTFSYSYTSPQNQTLTRQTEISADASFFGGLVTVRNNVHVEGAVRVLPSGNLSMGSYTQGPPPIAAQ